MSTRPGSSVFSDNALPPHRRTQVIGLLLLLVAAGTVRGVLIARAEVIARDGTTYVDMARQWTYDPRGVVDEYDYHVGYPALVAWTHEAMETVLGDDLDSWHLAGQLVSLAGGLAAVAAMFLLAVHVVGWPAGFLAALLWAFGRKWSVLGADVLSDAPAVACQLWALLLGLWMLKRLRRDDRWQAGLLLAFAAGVIAGGGYLIRPDALAAVMVILLLLIALAVRHRRRMARAAGAAVCCVAAASLVAAPYVLAIGTLSRKKSLSDIVWRPPAAVASAVQAGLIGSGDYFVLRHLVNMLFEAMHPVVGFLTAIWLAALLVQRIRRRPAEPSLGLSLLPDGRRLLIACLLVYAPLTMGLYINVGYLSHRHVMVLAAVLAMPAGLGVIVLGHLIARADKGRHGWLTRGRAAGAVAVVLWASMTFLHTIQPPHEGKGYHRVAGTWLREHRPPVLPMLVTDSPWVLHYSQWPGRLIQESQNQADTVAQIATGAGATHVAVSLRNVTKAMPTLPDRLGELGYQPVESFPSETRPDRRAVMVFARTAPPAEMPEPAERSPATAPAGP